MELMERLGRMYDERCRGKDGAYAHNSGMWPYMPLLRSLTLMTQAQFVIELGVHAGGSTAAFLMALAITDGVLWSCDLTKPRAPISALQAELTTAASNSWPLWNFVQGDSIELALAHEPPDRCDVLLVDAAFENRYHDLIHYAPRVKRGGYILIHDTNNEQVAPEVERFLRLGQHRSHYRDTWLPDNKGMVVINVT